MKVKWVKGIADETEEDAEIIVQAEASVKAKNLQFKPGSKSTVKNTRKYANE